MISLIVAASENNVIAKNNKTPWNLPEDLKFFKDKTIGHTVIMGRRTFEAIGRPLKNRRSIVLTKQEDFKAENCEVMHSKEEVLNNINPNEEVFVIGGEDIFREFLPNADRIYLTIIHKNIEGDKYFPELNMNDWKIIEENSYKSEKNNFNYSIILLVRK